MKKILGIVLIVVMLGSTVAYAAGVFDGIKVSNDKIYVNGQLVPQGAKDSNGNPIVLGKTKNNQNFAPLRGILEKAGLEIKYTLGRIDITSHVPTDYIKINTFINGTLVRPAIETSNGIINKAKEITAGLNTKEDKAQAIYNYVINRITYHDNGFLNVGAKFAFDSGTGVCYDYACLYLDMADAVGLNVRLIGGFVPSYRDINGNGVTDNFERTAANIYMAGHAWNEVQGTDGKWFSVDSTWGDGNYNSGWKFHGYDIESLDPNVDIVDVVGCRFADNLIVEYENY